MTFAPSSGSNQIFLSEDTTKQEPTPPIIPETSVMEDVAQSVGASRASPASETPADVPGSFTARTQRAFVRSSEPNEPVVAPVQLSYEERVHFAGGFGARMMAKMGWEVVSSFQLQIWHFIDLLLTHYVGQGSGC
jgi:hypothetical protein